MAEKHSSYADMPLFIQAMYGVVIGASSLKLEETFRDFNFFPGIFKFLFFGLTLLIAAHDWFTYHKVKRKKTDHPFWSYMPQVGSLFFLAQMLLSATRVEMAEWFAFGLFYTFFNWINLYQIDDEAIDRKGYIRDYWIHAGICVVGVCAFTLYKPSEIGLWHYGTIAIVAFIVILIWQSREKKENGSPKTIFTGVITIEESGETIAIENIPLENKTKEIAKISALTEYGKNITNGKKDAIDDLTRRKASGKLNEAEFLQLQTYINGLNSNIEEEKKKAVGELFKYP
jgi:hypothetical protein